MLTISLITAWVAITEADKDSGCLEVLEDICNGPLIIHCPARHLEIPEAPLASTNAKPLEVDLGDVIFFHPLTIHGSLALLPPQQSQIGCKDAILYQCIN